jgi:1,2-dihydroxy-3-keto-5-methylthiopentene dioxygenase
MTDEAAPPAEKKQKTMLAQSPDEEWPEAWLMTDEVEDQKALNRQEPNVPVTPADLKALGVTYWKMDADAFEYPVKAVPWDPKDATDPRLEQLRDDRGYSYADIITVTPEHLPGFAEKIKAFFEEHIHDAEEIRYVLNGSGFFDVRNEKDEWVRVWVKKGDLITLPEGIYHRFTCDGDDFIHAMRLFKGHPVWTPFNRPMEDHPSRKSYVEQFFEEKKEE